MGGRGDRGRAVRVVAARQPAAARARRTRPPVSLRSLDGTADAVATDHAPHTEVDKAVEFGLAANGISGIETALGVLLAAVDAGRLPLARAIEALTTRSGRGPRRAVATATGSVGLVEGAPADLVVFDRSDGWTVTADGTGVAWQEHAAARDGAALGACSSRSRDGRIAYEAPDGPDGRVQP